jgi:hypothetical protein
MRDAGRGQPLALAKLRGRDLRDRRRERMRDREPLGRPRRDRDRIVDSRGDDAVDELGGGQPVDGGLVFHGHDRPPVGEAEPGGERIAVDGDDVQIAVAGRLEQPELCGPRP